MKWIYQRGDLPNIMANTSDSSQDTYKSIAAPAEGLYKDKGSRFIAYAYPVSSEAEVKPLVDAIKKEHHAARHHCFSYRIGYDGALMRANDDGEPSGTAGRPILGVIDSEQLKDVLVVVVRYFGGILLGVPGLINAYREATRDAIANATVIEKTACRSFILHFGYLQMNDVQKVIKSGGVTILSQSFDMDCTMTVSVPLSRAESFADAISDKVDRME